MNAELDHIKTFIRNHLDPCYYDIAEEQMLINPICGVIHKMITENKLEIERIEKEKLQISVRNNDLRRQAEKIQKKENLINETISKNPELEYINHEDELSKLQNIKDIISRYFNQDIDRRTNKKEVVYARQMAMYYSRILTDLSLMIIGSKIAGRDHATVLHAIKVIENLKMYSKTQKHIRELNEIFNIKPMKKADLEKYIGENVMMIYVNKIGSMNRFACNITKINDTHVEIVLLERYHKEIPVKFSDIKEIKPL